LQEASKKFEGFKKDCEGIQDLFVLLFASFAFFLFFFLSSSKAYSRNHSSFFGSGEVEKKLASEVSFLKAKLASKQAELEAERQWRQVTEGAFRAQIGESEQRKNDALAVLQEVSEKSEGFKKDYEGIRDLFIFFIFSPCLFSFLVFGLIHLV